MRILHIIDKLSMDGVNPSSCTQLIAEWAKNIPKHECEMEVLSLTRDQTVGQYLRGRGIRDLYVDCPKYSPKILAQIKAFILGRNIDIVHLHGYGAAHFGTVVARQTGISSIVHEHAILKIKPLHFVIDWLLRNMTTAGVAVSESVREFMIRGRSIPAEKISVIGNGIDLSRFHPKTPQSVREARDRIGLPENVPVIGVVTRFREEKGTEHLIRAFGQIHDRFNDALLVIIGDGPLKESLKKIAGDEVPAESVHWLGFHPNIESLIPAFDIQVIPSLVEGYGLALAEAMASANAVVATEVGGLKEIGVDNENLLFVPPGDSRAIFEACTRLLENRHLARELAQNARRSAESMSIDRCAMQIVNLYKELMSGPIGEGES